MQIRSRIKNTCALCARVDTLCLTLSSLSWEFLTDARLNFTELYYKQSISSNFIM